MSPFSPSLSPSLCSLAIIMVEVLTHEAPYQDLLDFLEMDDILAAITGRKKITAQLPQVGTDRNLQTVDCYRIIIKSYALLYSSMYYTIVSNSSWGC